MGHGKLRYFAAALVLLVLLLWFLFRPPGSLDGPAGPADELGPKSEPGAEAPSPIEPDSDVIVPLKASTRRWKPPARAMEFGRPGLDGPIVLRSDDPKALTWLTGVLLGPDGEPLADVAVRLQPELTGKVAVRKNPRTGIDERVLEIRGSHFGTLVHRCERMSLEGKYVGKTDEDGRFVVPAPPGGGRYRVTFHPPGKQRKGEILHRTGRYRYTLGEEESLGAVRLPHPATIRGTVVDPEGRPIKGAFVSYWPDEYGVTKEDLVPTGSAPVDGIRWSAMSFTSYRDGLGRTETDAEGRFELQGVPPCTTSLFARGQGSKKVSTVKGIRVQEGEQIDAIRIVADVAEPPLLSGIVLDAETGKPVRAVLRLTVGGVTIGGFHHCRPDGTFLIASIPVGKYVLDVRSKDYEDGEFGPYLILEGDRQTGLELRLVPKKK